MIITRLLGGLGNQMFQYAAGLALAERRRTVLKLDVGWFREDPEHASHNRYGLSCFNVTEQFATREEIDRIRGRPFRRTESWAAGAASMLRLPRLAELLAHGGRWHIQKAFGFYPEFLELPDDTYIDGMWQSEKFFGASVVPILRQHFTFRYPAPALVLEMGERIRRGPSAFVHFRRGDYVSNPKFKSDIGVLGLDYYRRALEIVSQRHPGVTFFVFSDDIDTVEKEFRPPAPCVYVRSVQSWHSQDKIRLMSLCDHAVVSNSTFAWWAAWLNPNPAKLVCAPDPWFAGGERDGRDVVPQSWLRLPRDV